MTGPTGLISKYFQIQRSHQVGGIIGQLDTAAQLAAEQLSTDFVALFYRRHGDDTLIPVACHHRPDLSINSLELLDQQFSGSSRPTPEQAPHIEPISASDGDGVRDRFAAANGLNRRLVIALDHPEGCTSMVTAYWQDRPGEATEMIVPRIHLLLEMVARSMSLADRMHVVNDFSVRLAQTLSVLEADTDGLSVRKTAAYMIELIHSLIPACGACFLSEGSAGEDLNVVAFDDTSAEALGLVEQLAGLKEELFNRPSDNETNDTETATVDLTTLVSGRCAAAAGIEIQPDDDHRFILVIWTHRASGFAPNDLELLSILGLSAGTVLRSALHLRRLHRSKRTLEESSARMADVEALAALTDMTTGIAHDFNNVMGGIVGRVQLMKMKLDDGPILAGLNKIESLAMDGAETVRRIQEFTRRTRNKKLQPVNLAEIVRDCVEHRASSWRRLAEASDVTVSSPRSLDEAFVEGDSDDLTTLLDKLIENAVEHSPLGGRVEVVLEGDERSVTLTVNDQGDGIPNEIRKKVFYPFFTTKTGHGAGLGLAIAHGVTVSHGGRIEIDHGPEGGASLRVSFNCVDRADDDGDSSSGHGRPDRLRILVVDDDEQIREVLSDMLTIDGHSATACPDGYKALEAVDARKFDLIITDLGMPGMSGLDLAAVVHEKYPQIPIAMITGWGTQLDEEDVSLKGIKTVLPKPFHLKDVKAVVKELAAR